METPAGTLSYAGGAQGFAGTFEAAYLVRLGISDHPFCESARTSISEVQRVMIGRAETFAHERTHDGSVASLHIGLPDGWMSSQHAELCEDQGRWSLRDCDSKNGTFVNAERCQSAVLEDGDLIHTGNTTFLFRSRVERSHLDAADQSSADLASLPPAARTLSLPLAHIMNDMARVASSNVAVILTGETGTGKEVSARYIHDSSRRRGQFVAVNCGALPPNLVESELFGHRKGAFSGAQSDRIGLVQASDGGTLFLDEVAELPLEAQVKLLRVLQEREVVPVGATRPIPVDLRLVSATHADLSALVESGVFRSDLYARLNGICFELPGLRERREDIGLLTSTLLQRVSQGRAITFEREALWALALYTWPRNIRELEQALAAAVAWAQDRPIALSNLPAPITATLRPAERSEEEELKANLHTLLRKHRGNVSAAAREMGKARVQIRRWCKRFGMDPGQYR